MNRIARTSVCVAVACGLATLVPEGLHGQGLQGQPLPAGAIRFEVQSGSQAEYRVREQLARLNFPNDAVGTTQSVGGALVMRTDGTFTVDSRISVDLASLKTDEPKRDEFVRENTLETKRFPCGSALQV